MKKLLVLFGMAVVFHTSTANTIVCPQGSELRKVLRRTSIRNEIAQYLTTDHKIGTLETDLPDDNNTITVTPYVNKSTNELTCTYLINGAKAFTLKFKNE